MILEFVIRLYLEIQHKFFLSPVVIITMIIITFMTILALIGIIMIVLLDSVYRPNIPQYPYNIFLDRIIPLIAIISPSCIIFALNPENTTWFQKFGYIILLHLLILTPLMFFWSTHRNWSSSNIYIKGNEAFNTWKSSWLDPSFYFNLTIAIIYPTVWCFYFSCLRYLRLGQTIDLSSYLTQNYLIIFIIILIFVLLYRKIIINSLLICKSIIGFLWDSTMKLINSLLIIILRFRIIFKILEILYKLSFIWITFLIHYPALYRKYPKSIFRSSLYYLYTYPIIFFICIGIIIIIEMLINHNQLFYSLQIFLILMLLRPFMYVINNVNGPESNWIELCCHSNYLYGKWVNAYYPKRFWLAFQNMRLQYNNKPELTSEQNDHILSIIHKWEEKAAYDRRYNFHCFNRLTMSEKTGFRHRLRLSYYNWTNIK